MTLPKVCRNNRVRTHKMERVMVWMYSFLYLNHILLLSLNQASFFHASWKKLKKNTLNSLFSIRFDFPKFCISWPLMPSFSQQERVLRKVINTTAIANTEYSPSSALPSSGKAPSSGQNFGCGLQFTNTGFEFGHIFGRNLEFLA